MAQALGGGYDVVMIESVQPLSIESGRLCSSYANSLAAVDRLSATAVRLDRTRVPMSAVALNRLKALWRQGIGERACSRYRWDSGALIENAEFGGRSSRASRIELLRDRPILRVIE